jgi:hypothetical protein
MIHECVLIDARIVIHIFVVVNNKKQAACTVLTDVFNSTAAL